MNKLKKGDKVRVSSGKDKGREGTIEKVFSKTGKVLVTGVNVYKKHAKARQKIKGGIIDLIKPLPIASVVLVCPKCGKITRVGFQIGDPKVRICRKCKGVV